MRGAVASSYTKVCSLREAAAYKQRSKSNDIQLSLVLICLDCHSLPRLVRRDARWQVTALMQDVDDDEFIGHVDEHQEMLARPGIAQPDVVFAIEKVRAIAAGSPPGGQGGASVEQFGLVDISLTRPERLQRPKRYVDQALFGARRQPLGFHPSACRWRAFAKARRTACSPDPGARLPAKASSRPALS